VNKDLLPVIVTWEVALDSFILILLKNLRSSFESLRTNGEPVEIMGDFSVHAERVEAFLGFFSRIIYSSLTL